nr:hypothetical protein [Tanacetum cinerariifolium]
MGYTNGFCSLTEEEGWNRIEEYLQYQDDIWDEPSPSMNVSSISEAMQPTLRERLKSASINKSKTPEPKAPTFVITTRSRISTQDPPFLAPSQPTTYNSTERETKKEGLKKQKKDDEDERLLSTFKQIHINLPFLEAMIHMPKGAKVLKDLLSHKEKLKKAATSLNLVRSVLLLLKEVCPKRKETQLADRSIKYPIGVCENLLVKVSKFIFPINFVVLEMDEDEKSMKPKHSRDDYLCCADHTVKLVQEQWVNTVNHDRKWTEEEEEEEEESNKALTVSFYPRTESVEPLEWKALENRLKPSSVKPPKLKLKELPEHLETFTYKRMPFGLCNAPATFQRCMTAIFHELIEDSMEVFMDDFSVFGSSFGHCLKNLEKMLKRFRQYLVLSKTLIFMDHSTLRYLFTKQDAKPRLIRWILLLQEFDIKIHDKKGAENLAVDHLSRLEHPDLKKLTRAEIRDLFLEERLMAISDKNNKQCGPSGGHHGIATTTRKVFEASFYWPHIFRDGRKLVQVCDAYFMRPFPTSNGKKYILVAIDYVSKWVEAQAFPTSDARNVVNFLRRLFVRFGIPKALISDVDKRSSREHEPRNKAYSQKTIGNNRKDWSYKLDDALWAFWTAFKTPLGTTLFRIIYGKACHLPVKLEQKAHWAIKNCNMDLAKAGENWFLKINELDEMRLDAYESSISYKERTKRLFPEELKSRWYGPFSVSKYMKNKAIKLYDEEGSEFIVNKQRLKPYQKNLLDTNKDDDITLDDEGEVTYGRVTSSLATRLVNKEKRFLGGNLIYFSRKLGVSCVF